MLQSHNGYKAGVYYFTVQLMSEDGTTELYSGSTLSVSSDDRLTADIDPGVVKITSISNGKELSISDLRKFFGVSNIKDGKYKVIVTAFDVQGSATSSEAVGFIMDTTRPGMVQVKNAQALAINRGDFTSNELVVEWEAIEDLSGIDYYEVKYRMVGAEDWITRNIKETKFSVEVNSNGENTQFEYCITAIDQNGNRGIEWIENGIITSIPDHFFDTLANAKDISEFGWNHGDDFVINEETVGLGDVADTFKLVTTYGRTLEISASDFEVLFGTVGNVKVEIFKHRC